MRMDGCITDEELAGWAEASHDDVAAMSAHIARCDTCRVVLAEVTRTSGQRPAPAVLGRYVLEERLGAGGMGTVWAAYDPSVDRRVALKVLHEGTADGESRTQRFLHERQVLAGLEHPHIARLLDAGETDEGRPWFAMDLVDGRPIDQYCDERHLTTRQRLELMLPVLAAVSHAHQHLVVHRDLKPGNILVDAQGAPRLVDFGIARLLEGAATGLTQTGMTPMTPAFASPEQVRREPATTTSDVYSLGVVLYELLTGVSPYAVPPGDLEALLRAIREQEPRPPSQAVERATDAAVASRGTTRARLRRELAADVDAIVLMALRKEPRDRYPSVQALADDVRAALNGLPTVARRGNSAYRAARFVRRHRVLVAALTAGVLALVAGLVSTLWQARRAERERDLAQRRFDQVRSLAKVVLFDYHDGVAALPGSTALRARMVDDARAYLDALSAEAQDDLTLRKELARAWLRLGDVQGEPSRGSLGRLEDAKVSYLRAQQLAEGVLVAAPDDVEARQLLVAFHQKLGDNLGDRAAMKEALAEYQQARALGEALARERPDDAEARLALALVDIRSADALRQQGQLDEAATRLEAALSALADEVKVRPALGTRSNLAIAHRSLSIVRQEQGRLPDAVSHAQQAEQLYAALVQERPADAELKRMQGTVWSTLVSLYNLTGDQPRAVEYARKDAEASRAAVKADPRNAVARRDLMASLSNLLVALGLGEATEAPAIEKEVLELQRASCAEAPGNLRWRGDLVQVLSLVGTAESERGHFTEAEALFQELLRVGASLPRTGPDAMTVQERMAIAHLGLADVYAGRKRFDDALAENRLAVEGFEALLAEHPSLERLRNLWAIGLGSEGQILVKRAEAAPPAQRRAAWQAAADAFERALAGYRALEAKGAATAGVTSAKDEALAALAACQQALKPSAPRP